MTIVYDSIIKEYVYFNAIKQPGASLKYLIPSSAMQAAESASLTPSKQAVESTNTEATKTGYNQQL
jgi:hypothetical protein